MGGVTGDLLRRAVPLVAILKSLHYPSLYLCAYLVPQSLAGNDGDLIADALVGLEVEGELGVVALDDDLGGLLNSLRPDATHFGGSLSIGRG